MENWRAIARGLLDGLAAAGRAALGLLRLVLTLLLALVLVFEEWGWRPLAALLAELARFRPWARVEAWIAGLPPYAALIVFGLPTTLLLPVKLAAFYFLANGQPVMATAVLVLAKLLGTALVARIFLLTKPTLMQLAWFARAYNWFMPWNEALTAWVRATWAWRYGRLLKIRALHEALRLVRRVKPYAAAAWASLKAATAGWHLAARLWAHRSWRRLRRIFDN